MITKKIKKEISYTSTISKNILYGVKTIENIFYKIYTEGMKAFKGRLKYYDNIEMGRLDKCTLDYLDEIEER